MHECVVFIMCIPSNIITWSTIPITLVIVEEYTTH